MINFYNSEKLERAKVLAGAGATEEAILAAYVKLGGKYESFERENAPAPQAPSGWEEAPKHRKKKK